MAKSTFLADLGEIRGCSKNTFVIHSLIERLRDPLVHTALWRRHAQTVKNRTSSYKIDYFIVIKNFLNPDGHQNPISISKVTAILLKGWIWPICGVSAGGGSAPAACAAGLFSHYQTSCNLKSYRIYNVRDLNIDYFMTFVVIF